MLAAERRNIIKDYILKNGSATVDELARRFAVSEETIRRDLTRLDREGLVEKNYGGATAIDDIQKMMLNFTSVQQRRLVNTTEKNLIADEAAKLVRPGMGVFIDSGSTTWAMVRHLGSHERLTIVTNSLEVAQDCAKLTGCTLIVLGGQVITKSMSMVGPNIKAQLNDLSIDIAFLGATGVSVKGNCASGNLFGANVKKLVVEAADRAILMVDHSKMGRNEPFTFARFADFDAVISSAPIPPEIRQTIADANTRLIIVGDRE